MGYCTNFVLKTENDPLDKGLNELRVKSGYTWYKNYLSDAKWYDWLEVLTSVSSVHPSVRFTLTGEGEDREDRWEAYALGGAVQVCPAILTYEANTLWGAA